MTDFKFLHATDVGHVLDGGTVLIRTHWYYRQLKQEQWIADRLENGAKIEVAIFHSKVHAPEELVPKGVTPPRIIRGGGNLVMMDCNLVYYGQETFIFCASRGDFVSLAETMCRLSVAASVINARFTEPYDACLRIKDIKHLAHRMYHRGVVVEMGNAKVNDLFDEPRVGEVTYVNLSGDSRTRRPPAPIPSERTSCSPTNVRCELSSIRATLLRSKRLPSKSLGRGSYFEEMPLPIKGRKPIESATAFSRTSPLP